MFLVVIHDLDVKSIPIPPHETHTVLIVDSNAVLSRAVTPKCLQMMSRWHPQVIELDGCIQGKRRLLPDRQSLSVSLSRKLASTVVY